MYKGKKSYGKLFITSGYSPITFEFLKETFNKVAFLVLLFVKCNSNFAITTWFNASCCPTVSNLFSKFVGIVSGVRHHYAGFKIGKKKVGNCHVVDLTGCQFYLNRIAESINHRMNFRCIAAATFAY